MRQAPALPKMFNLVSNKPALLSDRERAHVKQVAEMQARGENPFTHLSGFDQGGQDKDRKARKETTEDKSLNRMTPDHARPTIHGMRLTADSPLIQSLALGDEEVIKVPFGFVRCSFCTAVVPEYRATIGAIAPRMRKTITVDGPYEINGVLTYNNVIKHRPDNGAACPKHSLLIVPLEDKDGNVIASGQKWPETE